MPHPGLPVLAGGCAEKQRPPPLDEPPRLSELAAVKTAQASLTDAQKGNITYWSAGGVLRWNQILRELVARSDLPPGAQSPVGSYPSPSPANPFADPQYPFSNPPYAARAYSYASVAQYDALEAWYYKYLYYRPSPFR